MSTASLSPARRQSVQEIIGKGALNRATQTQNVEQSSTKQTAQNSIASNAFYKIMLNDSIDPEDKKVEVAKLLTYEGTKAENAARIKEFEDFQEFLQEKRQQMAVQIISLSDTKAFSELQSCYKDMNGALVDFDNKMKPLTDIIDALYELRTDEDGNKILETFKEIQEDKKNEAEYTKNFNDLTAEFNRNKKSIADRELQIISLQQQKSFFGFGGIKREAQEQIDNLQYQNSESVIRTQELGAKLNELIANKKVANEGDFRKAKLRELLDVSSPEHNKRQEDLVKAALTFVSTAKERVGSVREHLSGMGDQIEKLLGSNTRMSGIYAITSEALTDAQRENQKKRDQLLPPTLPEGETESLIAKMKREDKKMDLDTHIRTLDTTAKNTVTTYADLEGETIRIKTMKDSNDDQVSKARVLHSQGIGGVADRLSVVLNAVSAAAIGESSAMAKNNIQEMVESTNRIAQKEAIRVAIGGEEMNRDILKSIEELGNYGEIYRTATGITRNTVSEMRSNLDKLMQEAQGIRKDVRDAYAVNADMSAEPKAPLVTTKEVDF